MAGRNVAIRTAFWLAVGLFSCAPHATLRAAEAESTKARIERDVVYAEPDGQTLHADVYVPAGAGPFPSVLLVHGGAWIAGDRSHMEGIAKTLVKRGYVAVAMQYRFAPRYQFPAQSDDCQSALAWMKTQASQYHLDVDRIGGWGYSAGAQMIALQATRGPTGPDKEAVPKLRCAVTGGTPCDFRPIPPDLQSLAYFLGGTKREKPAAYKDASPVVFVTSDAPPMLLYHGHDDALVPLATAQAMHRALDAAKVPNELLILPSAGHIATFFAPEGVKAGCDFMDKYLKPAGAKKP